MPGVKPFWMSSELGRLEIENAPIGGLATAIEKKVAEAAKPLKLDQAKLADILERAGAWYDAQVDNTAQPIVDLLDASAGYLDDTWTTGIHLFLPYPDYGGFGYLRSALLEAMDRQTDPNRPLFSDDLYAGGILLVFAGSELTVLSAMAAVASLYGGSPQVIMEVIGELLLTSAPMAKLADGFIELANTPAQLWSQGTRALDGWYRGSVISKIASGGFPADLLAAATAPPDPVTPSQLQEGRTANVTLRGKFPPNLVLFYGNTGLRPYSQDTERIEISVPGRLIKAGRGQFIGRTLDGAGNLSQERVLLGEVSVSPKNPYDALPDPGDDKVFDFWRAMSVGTAVGSAFPGSISLVRMAVNAIDQAGQALTETGNMVKSSVRSIGQAANGITGKVNSLIDQVPPAAASLVSNLGTAAAATLIIPPEKGGIHQLGFALGQGLSDHALNAPDISESDVVGAVFLCAGAATTEEVYRAMRQFGQSFGITALANL